MSILAVALASATLGGAVAVAADDPAAADWLGAVSESIRRAEYQFSALPDGSHSAPNRAHDLRSTIGPDGSLRVVSRTRGAEAFELVLTPSRLGREGALEPLGPGAISVNGSRIEIDRGNLVDWYVNDERGLEQGFILRARPPDGGATQRPPSAWIELALGGTLSPVLSADGRAIDFATAAGARVLRYAHPAVTDAAGRSLPAWIEGVAGGIRLAFDDRAASYPVTVDPLLTSPAWTVESDQVFGLLGSSVATAGDVNGDGYSDVLVGAWNYDNGTPGEGQAYLYFGSASGLPATPSWTGENNENSQFGSVVAPGGDVNGDGYDDILVGAPGYSNGQAFEGRLYAYYGSSSGPAGSPDWIVESDQADARLGDAATTAGDVNGDGYADVIVGDWQYDAAVTDEGRALLYLGSAAGLAGSPAWTAEGDQFNGRYGNSVSTAGDVNGDGYADVIVGAHNHSNDQSQEGRAYLYLGAPAGLGLSPAWTAEGNQEVATFGVSVAAAGDVNGDGYADVIVGAESYDNSEQNEGRAFVYLGSASGLTSAPAWTAESDQALAEFGNSVATAGDVNGDGYGDVIVGAHHHDNGQGNEGRAYVYLGSVSGLAASPDWTAESDQNGAAFGDPVATAGDVNGDGYADVIVGAATYSNGQLEEGRAFVYHGSAMGLATTAAWTAEGDQADANLGYVVSNAGDVNDDGYGDVVVGARWYDNGQTDEGRAYVYEGSADGLGTSPGWTAEGDQVSCEFGHSVATAGDVNGDGYADVIVGARIYDNPTVNEGSAFVYLGSASGLAETAAWTGDDGDSTGVQFGQSVSTAGDVNGDGYSDVIVGAIWAANGQMEEGRAFVYHGSAAGLSTSPAWTAESNQVGAGFGISVATAGDVNGDGYSDVIVGAHFFDDGEGNEGSAFVYHGSALGLSASHAWTASSNQADAEFGFSVASAGDVNGDGYSDVIVGASQLDNPTLNEGAAFVYLGSASGLAAGDAWSAESDQGNARFGRSVATAGDVNGDGYSDVIVGAYWADNGQADEGRAFVYRGSASGLDTAPAWIGEIDEVDAQFGWSVSTAGDVNGDGFSDVIVGAYIDENNQSNEGRAFVYYGNGDGLDRVPRQARADGYAAIGPLGRSDSDGAFRLRASGRTPAGRCFVRLEWEVEPLGTPFDGLSLGSGPWVDTQFPEVGVGSAAPLDQLVAGLVPGTPHKWRLRIASASPLFPHSPWLYGSWNGVTETDFRTAGLVAPFVTFVKPPDNALGAVPSTSVTLALSEPVAAGTVGATTVRLLDPLGTPVPATVALDPGATHVTLDPTSALAADTLYTVQLTSGVQDLAGQSAVAFTSHFRTTAATTTSTPLPDPSEETTPPPNPAEARTGAALDGAGDLDGDGLRDFVAGAAGYEVGTDVEAGAAVVYLGSSDPAALATPDIIFTGEAAHDRAGTSVAGDFDFNADGRPDLLIGAEQVDRATDPENPTPTGAGKAYLIYFDPTDATHYPLLNDANPATTGDVVDLGLVGQPGGLPGVVFTGERGAAGGHQAGFAVAAGGRIDAGTGQDIAIGAPGGDPAGGIDAGIAYVVFDDPGLSGAIDLGRVANGLGDQVGGVRIEGERPGDAVGHALAFPGNVIGNVGDDLAIGAPLADPPGGGPAPPLGLLPEAGIVYVLSGGGVVSVIIESCTIGGPTPGGQVLGDQAGMQLGFALSGGGDSLANGQDDLLIGAPYFDFDTRVDAGLVVQTSSTLPNGVIIESCTIGGPTTPGALYAGEAAGDALGYAVADLGDTTGNGLDDVLLGAPFASPDGVLEAGATYLIEGAVAGSLPGGPIDVGEVGLTLAGQVLVGVSLGEHAGAALAGTGDLTGDGSLDFVVGAPDDDVAADPNAGTIYVVTEVELPPPGYCGVDEACTVADLSTGAQLDVPAGALGAPVQMAVTALLAPGGLPALAPVGQALLGAVMLDPTGQALSVPAALHLAVRPVYHGQLTPAEPFDLYRFVTSAWVDTGSDGTVGDNPHYAGLAAVDGSVTTLGLFAVFVADLDGDGLRDTLDPDLDGDGVANGTDNCPAASNTLQFDCDLDLVGDACDVDLVDADGDVVDDACDNCTGLANPTQQNADGDAAGDACDPCPVESPDDQDGDGLCCPVDNCCTIANASQADLDLDGTGDACDTNPVLVVSSDVGDDPDFTVIQDAVDAAVQSGTRILIRPGLGPYAESVTVDRGMVLEFVGTGGPVVVDGGTGAAFDVTSTSGDLPMQLRGLTLRGQTGLVALVPTDLESVAFGSVAGVALDLGGGDHRALGLTMDSTVQAGIDVAAGASLVLERSSLIGLGGTALSVAGSADLETVLIGGAADGILLAAPGAQLALRHATVSSSVPGAVGVDNVAGGTVSAIAHAIVYGNPGGDLLNVACAVVSWSDIGSPDCSSVNDNVVLDALFVNAPGGDYRLSPVSPLLDHGPDPATYTGQPCRDLDGDLRLRDFDGDGLARLDPGAYERANAALVPGEVGTLSWTDKGALGWPATAGAVEYHVYRGLLSSASYATSGACRDDLDGDLGDETLTDGEVPPPGSGYYYTVTADDLAGPGGDEGTLGAGSCAERSSFDPCP